MTTKAEIPLWESMKMPFKEWRAQLTEYFAAIGDVELLDKGQKPDGEPNYLPVASNPAAFIAKCKGHDQEELLVKWTGLTKSAAQIRALKEEDLDDDDIEMYLNKVKRHNKRADAAQEKLDEWPKRCAAAAAKIKIAIRNNKEARRAIEKIEVDDGEIYKILEKLKTRFGDMQESAKAEVLLKHGFLMYEPGATAEEFTEIEELRSQQSTQKPALFATRSLAVYSRRNMILKPSLSFAGPREYRWQGLEVQRALFFGSGPASVSHCLYLQPKRRFSVAELSALTGPTSKATARFMSPSAGTPWASLQRRICMPRAARSTHLRAVRAQGR
jgi:hypothetical protein